MPDNESNTAAISQALRYWIKDLDADAEIARIKSTDPRAKIDTAAMTEAIEAIRQWVKDLDAEVERINAAREAMPPPISPNRRAAKQTAPKDGRLRD